MGEAPRRPALCTLHPRKTSGRGSCPGSCWTGCHVRPAHRVPPTPRHRGLARPGPRAPAVRCTARSGYRCPFSLGSGTKTLNVQWRFATVSDEDSGAVCSLGVNGSGRNPASTKQLFSVGLRGPSRPVALPRPVLPICPRLSRETHHDDQGQLSSPAGPKAQGSARPTGHPLRTSVLQGSPTRNISVSVSHELTRL